MNAFTALLVNGYHELNNKKLFWVTLLISLIVVLFYASIGFNDQGMFFFYGLLPIESEMFTQDSPLSTILYRGIFSSFIVGLWLAWVLVILALVAASPIFPDTMADGTIDLTLAKPIRRLTLFSFKYITGLLFVLLQVAVFCLGIFICMGWRIGEWNWIIFSAVPMTTLLFSYLYAVNVLIGVFTRSALAALLLTLLFWFMIWILNTGAGITETLRQQALVEMEQAEAVLDDQEQRLQDAESLDEEDRAVFQAELDDARTDIDDARDFLRRVDYWYKPIRAVQTAFPKTSESVGLVDRWLIRDDDISFGAILTGNVEPTAEGGWREAGADDEEFLAQERTAEEYRSRSLFYIIGTSLIFEFIVLAIAAWRFIRRDF